MILILAVGAALSGAAFRWVHAATDRRMRDDFQRASTALLRLLEQRRDRYEELLFTLGYLFSGRNQGVETVSPERFSRVARNLMERHPGLSALEWIPSVSQDQRGEVEAFMRRSGVDGFEIRDRASTGEMQPASTRERYRPILYVEPMGSNRQVVGYDILNAVSFPQQELALATATTTITPLITLVQRPNETSGLIILVPIYTTIPAPEDLAARRAGFRGFVQAVCHAPTLFNSLMAEVTIPGLDVLILDEGTDARARVLCYYPSDEMERRHWEKSPNPNLKSLDGEFSQRVPLRIGGRFWEISLRASSFWIREHDSGLEWLVLSLGLGLTGLVGWTFHQKDCRRAEVEQEIEARTAELKSANDHLADQVRERQLAEAALLRTQATLITAQRLGRLGSWEVHVPSGTLAWSQEMYRIFGLTEGKFQPTREGFYERVHPDDRTLVRAAFQQALMDRKPYHVEHRIVWADGTIRHLVEHAELLLAPNGEPVQMVGAAQDISERREQEAERERMSSKLQETQRLESLGILAGGIAHDFNNLLTGVLGNASLLKVDLPRHSESAQLVAEIENEAVRAAELCRQMLAYAGKARFVLAHTDLTHMVMETTRLLKVSISKRVELCFDCVEQLPLVYVDVTQLRQILMNLVINASEAIGAQDGKILLSTGFVTVSAVETVLGAYVGEAQPGDYVFFKVEDSGCGMTPQTLARIFDPFFTTKFTGRGLGLAAAVGIIRGHRGFIRVVSEPDRGSTFCVYLPVATDAPPSASVSPKPSRAARGYRGGRILVVDDEESVRRYAERALITQGFQVASAPHGLAGLELLRKDPSAFSGVVIDLTMPVMSGEETLREIRKQHPQMPAVIMSGYSHEEAVDRFSGQARLGFLQKPFSAQALESAVSQVLAEAERHGAV